jgi:hypothetical protein
MPLPGPKAAAIIARDCKVVSTSYTRDYPFVMAKARARSSRMWTAMCFSIARPVSP